MVSAASRGTSSHSQTQQQEKTFCHTFDLTKRLAIPIDAKINHISIPSGSSPLASVLSKLQSSLQSSPPNSIHRLVIPTSLSPALYPPTAGRPENFLHFLHSLRALLRQNSDVLTAMITLPLELYPRSTGLIRWAEILTDGVVELTPFPHLMDASNSLAESGGARANEEKPQGLVKVHKFPIDIDRGEGGAGAANSIGQNLAFTVSRRKFVIKPFSLPPVEGDQEAQRDSGTSSGKDMEF
jgi:elongator complex protein 4